MIGRLVSGRRPEIPADLAVAVGLRETGPGGACAVVVNVAAAGLVRVHYAMTEPAGPTWMQQVRVSERARRRALGAALACGTLDAPGPRGGSERPAPHGWLHVTAGGRSAWTPLDAAGRVPGRAVPVLGRITGLVPGRVWADLHARRDSAWRAWAAREVEDLRAAEEETLRAVPEADMTRPDGSAGTSGWPGVRHGGGLGGHW
ncbi:hypothetical protein [Actinomadura hibisca]|uniref:hypothetical protein n=1 Tax=Actinomadura hibisca TaxID=68565 RepID=UPI000837A75B|nr:hypothetical protein [Actinomadura hibisca]